jgi:AcrR family transcriptional regulator
VVGDAGADSFAHLGARDRILSTAKRLFYEEGLRAVGVDRVIAEADVAKATLYAHFPSKDDLIVAYLEQVDTEWRAQLRAAAAAAGSDPRAQLAAMFDAVLSACLRSGYSGCGFLNAAAESRPGEPARETAVRHKTAVREWVTELAAEAGAADPQGLAVTLTVLLDGALADTALDRTDEAALRAKEAAEVLVMAACVNPSAHP